MAENEITKGDTLPPGIEADPLARAFVYRMRRDALMAFHGLTVHENIADRRGSRRRFDAVRESAQRSSSHDTPRT